MICRSKPYINFNYLKYGIVRRENETLYSFTNKSEKTAFLCKHGLSGSIASEEFPKS